MQTHIVYYNSFEKAITFHYAKGYFVKKLPAAPKYRREARKPLTFPNFGKAHPYSPLHTIL